MVDSCHKLSKEVARHTSMKGKEVK